MMTKVINIEDWKTQKEHEAHRKRVEYWKKQEPFNERMQRIRNSLDKINKLMGELRENQRD